MPRLQNVFSHLLPILDEPTSYIPMFNSTILYDPINTTFLHNILGDANRTLVDDPLWNVHLSTLSGDARTNNFSEGSNNALNTAAGCSSPTISRLMGILCRFNAEAETKILQASTGQDQTRKQRQKIVLRNERIKMQENC